MTMFRQKFNFDPDPAYPNICPSNCSKIKLSVNTCSKLIGAEKRVKMLKNEKKKWQSSKHTQKKIRINLKIISKSHEHLQTMTKQEGHDGPVTLVWVSLREPDLELIKAHILTKIHNDYINK